MRMGRVKYLQVQLHLVSVQFCLISSSYLKQLVQDVEIMDQTIADYLTIIPRARRVSESIAHEAKGRMGY